MHLTSRTRLARPFLAAVLTLAFAPGCELATHFGDYQQGGDTGVADGGQSDAGDTGARDAGHDSATDANIDAAMGMDADIDANLPDGGDAGPMNDAGADAAVPTHTVTVTLSGSGMATLTSSDSTFSCTSAASPCSWNVPEGTFTIESAPDATSVLASWDGACSSTATTSTSCTVTVSGDLSLGATYSVRQVHLDVGITGVGTVTSSAPASLGINCAGSTTGCTAAVNAGTSVTLHAAPGTGYNFTGWNVASCTGTGDCTFTIVADTHVDATFTDGRVAVRVALAGDGSGAIASDMGTISCGTTCSDLYVPGTHVTLTATPTLGTDFTSWANCPSAPSGNTCAFDVPATGTTLSVITATFTLQRFTVTVRRSGSGTGVVSSASPPINCGVGAGCIAANIAYGTMITLSETPNVDSNFGGWSGVSGCGAGSACSINVTSNITATATFTLQTVHITFNGAGAGSGTLTTDDGQINCVFAGGTVSGTCAADYTIHSPITVRAAGATGSVFSAWSSSPGGYCGGGGAACSFTAEEDIFVTGAFNPQRFDMNVTVVGTMAGAMTGIGTVGISPATVSTCASSVSPGNTCTNNYAYNTVVTLTATASPGSVFTGWGGDCLAAGASTTCMVTIAVARNVTAAFAPNVASLNVSTSGASQGTVTDGSGMISCGATCSASFVSGTIVTLTASANAANGYVFGSWGGACAAAGTSPTCMVTISGVTNVSAVFNLSNRMVFETIVGPSLPGSVLDPGGIGCTGGTCGITYPYGSNINLTATPNTGYVFVGWSGCPLAAGNTCTINPLTADTSITATFAVQTVQVVVSLGGTGGGVVTGNGINCHSPSIAGDTCSVSVNYGTSVLLTATPQLGSVQGFWGAGGPCAGSSSANCSFTATSTTSVPKDFTLQQFQLTVNKSPAIGGLVTSLVPTTPSINCGATCSATFDYNTVVRLSASPVSGYRFGSWSVASCGSNPTCDVTMNMAQTVTANFVQTRTLSVTIPAGATFVRSANVSSVLPAGLNCTNTTGSSSVTCMADFDVGATIHLVTSDPTYRYYGAQTWSFGGGSPPVCIGHSGTDYFPDCTFTMPAGAAALLLTVTFGQLGNLAFVTSTTYNGGFFSPFPATPNGDCNSRAAAAGLPGNYMAWISTTSSSIGARLPSALNVWVRPDGRPVATTRTNLLNGTLTHPIALDEFGNPVVSNSGPNTTGVWTGTTPTGASAGQTCVDWASTGSTGIGGLTTATTNAWTNNAPLTCGSVYHLFCLQTDISSASIPRALVPNDAVYIFVTNGFDMGNGATAPGTVDTICGNEAMAAGLPGTYVALLSTSTVNAYSRARLFGTLTRPDGWPVGPHQVVNSVLDTPAAPPLATFNIQANGTILGGAPLPVWNGMNLNANSSALTCTDWTSSGSAVFGAGGFPGSIAPSFYAGYQNQPCNTVSRFYCIQSGP